MRHHLGQAPSRRAYYPGAQDRYQCFLDTYPDAEVLGERADEVVPWTLIRGVGTGPAEYALNTEAFCGILAVVELEANEPGDYLEQAVTFCNERMWGTLCCNLLVHPKTEAALHGAVDEAIAALRYGAIGVNCWSG